MKKKFLIPLTLLLLLLIILSAVFLSRQKVNVHAKKNFPTVQTTKVALKEAPLFLKTQGSLEASRSVSVEPQVSGIIQKVVFTPGQQVKAGQLLFSIDPSTYQAALAKEEATLSKDEAQLEMLKKNKSRYQSLAKQGFVSQESFDQIETQLAQQLSTVKLDEASIQQARYQLGYTQILAPISGKTGNVTIKQGDLVDPSNHTVLVTINQMSPLLADFYIPQNKFNLLQEYLKKNSVRVEVYSENQKLLDIGKIAFIDNVISNTTGTLLVKASLPNKNLSLWPGETVSIKLLFTVNKNVLAIPSKAVQNSENGNFVYLIKNNQVIITPIEVLRQVGQWTFIQKGLSQSDEVAVVFPPNLQDRQHVVVTNESQ